MTMKRSSSTKTNLKKKIPKLNTKDDVADYTKLLTTEDIKTIETGDEQELDNAEKPKKIKSTKKVQGIKKKGPKTNKENKTSKRSDGKTGMFNIIL